MTEENEPFAEMCQQKSGKWESWLQELKLDLAKSRDIDVLIHMWDTGFMQTYCQCNESLEGSQFAHPNFQFEEDVEMPFSAWPTEETHWRFSKNGLCLENLLLTTGPTIYILPYCKDGPSTMSFWLSEQRE